MQKIVQKFGGTSVGTIDKIKHVCSLINKEIKSGNQLAVVSSAMSGETNKLVSLAENFDINKNKLEFDMIVSTGEQVSIALISMALKEIGLKGKPLLGWQVPITGTNDFTKAKINKIDDSLILSLMKKGEIY